MSHLSDAALDMHHNLTQAELRIEFTKWLIIKFGDDINQDIDPDLEYTKFREFYKPEGVNT